MQSLSQAEGLLLLPRGPETDEGAVFVYFGSSTGIPATESWFAEGNQANAQFGFSVAATDLSYLNDGYSDIVVGAPYYDHVVINDDQGEVFIWYGSSSGLGPNGNPSNAAQSFFDVTSDGAHSGWSVAAGGNVKYFGHPGIIIGAPDESSGGMTGNGGATAWAVP